MISETTKEINAGGYKIYKEWRKWCEKECPDRLNSECWADCRWLDEDEAVILGFMAEEFSE